MEGYANDAPLMTRLVESTSKRFQMKEVYADKGYCSRECFNVISDHGAIPYIPFKRNTQPKARNSPIWKAMYHYFTEHKEEFLQHYHLRSNAESVFSMMKRKQGTYLRSRNEVAQVNELLCKVLVHNICVLIQEMFENDVKIDFAGMGEDELMCKILP